MKAFIVFSLVPSAARDRYDKGWFSGKAKSSPSLPALNENQK